ncbi:MAG: serine hydrolase [Bacteroidia bacterium]|nr:serine hydrolase [Bacteroidia bacterium]
MKPYFFLLILFIIHPLYAQESFEEELKSVDSLFTPWAKPNSPGAALGIYKDGKLIYTQGYGMSNLEYDIPIKPNSIFHVASISKQFTNFAVLLLEEEGKLSIEDDIRKHMPEIPDFGKTITIRQLMHHTSGYRDQWQLLALAGWRLDDVITKEQIMRLIEGQRELNFEPGSQYRYSNSGYSILARLVEKISGKSFRQFAKDRIFKPLGMKDTHVHDDHERIVPRRAYSYRPDGLFYKKSVLSYSNDGATSLFTTVEDMGKWMNNMLKPTLGKSFIVKMRTKGILNNGDEINYGLGQSVNEYKGLSWAGHGGADAGFRSTVRWYPEHDFGLVVLSNLASFNPSLKANQISDIFLGEHFVKEEKKEEKPIEAVPISSKELEKYQGRFVLTQYGINFTVKAEEDKLFALLEWSGEKFHLIHLGDDSFLAEEDPGLRLMYKLKKGEIEKIDMLDGKTELDAIPYINYEVSEAKLGIYEGNFYSSELDTFYKIRYTEEGLIASHHRHGNIKLTQNGPHTFSSSAWWMGKIEFVFGKKNELLSFLVGGGRVDNLRFEKVGD